MTSQHNIICHINGKYISSTNMDLIVKHKPLAVLLYNCDIFIASRLLQSVGPVTSNIHRWAAALIGRIGLLNLCIINFLLVNQFPLFPVCHETDFTIARPRQASVNNVQWGYVGGGVVSRSWRSSGQNVLNVLFVCNGIGLAVVKVTKPLWIRKLLTNELTLFFHGIKWVRRQLEVKTCYG